MEIRKPATLSLPAPARLAPDGKGGWEVIAPLRVTGRTATFLLNVLRGRDPRGVPLGSSRIRNDTTAAKAVELRYRLKPRPETLRARPVWVTYVLAPEA